jgi:hypothetical protein
MPGQQHGTLKLGYQRMAESVVLDQYCSGYKGNHLTRIMLGGSAMAGLLDERLFLSCLRRERVLNALQERTPN